MQLFQKIFFGSSTTTLILSNEELNDIMKIIKSLEDSGLLIKGFAEEKGQKEGFLGTLAATLGASLLGNTLAGKGILRDDKGTFRADKNF